MNDENTESDIQFWQTVGAAEYKEWLEDENEQIEYQKYLDSLITKERKCNETN